MAPGVFPMFHTFFRLSCLHPSVIPNLDLYACAPAGSFLGHELTSDSGRFIAAFSGIRYAVPPTNELRFQDTVPYEYQKNRLIVARDEGPSCLQYDSSNQYVLGDEDCLYLNVYTPNVQGEAPVIIWIHGGAFTSGSGSRTQFGPEYILDQNVVLVTINYRLGILGFGSTEDETLRGNWGQGDQAEAIRWVVRNIKSFGGDPENLTVFGQSSGAVSTMLHLKMPQVKNLIRRGIAHSGSTLVPWATSKNRIVRNRTLTVAERVGCSYSPRDYVDESFVECLLRVNATDLVRSTLNLTGNSMDFLPFRPVLDPAEFHSQHFSSDVPLLIGFMEDEASYFYNAMAATIQNSDVLISMVKAAFPQLLATLLGVESKTNVSDIALLAERIADFYWGGQNSTDPDPVVKAFGDALITFPVYQEAQIHQGPVYTFLFNYTLQSDLNSTRFSEPSHSDELKFFFPSEATQLRANSSARDIRMSKTLVKIWTDFARGRDPVPKLNWASVSRRSGYLDISNKGFNLADVIPQGGGKSYDFSSNEMSDRLRFWSTLIA